MNSLIPKQWAWLSKARPHCSKQCKANIWELVDYGMVLIHLEYAKVTTVLHTKGLKITLMKFLRIYCVMVHASGTYYTLNVIIRK